MGLTTMNEVITRRSHVSVAYSPLNHKYTRKPSSEEPNPKRVVRYLNTMNGALNRAMKLARPFSIVNALPSNLVAACVNISTFCCRLEPSCRLSPILRQVYKTRFEAENPICLMSLR